MKIKQAQINVEYNLLVITSQSLILKKELNSTTKQMNLFSDLGLGKIKNNTAISEKN